MYSYEPPKASDLSIRDLKQLVQTGEGKYLEFKRIISTPEKIAREISAFANTNGGTLLIGVDDDLSIVGVESYHEQEFLLEQAAKDLCSPHIEYSFEILPFKKREVIIAKIKESQKKPVYMRSENGKRKVFIRIDDKSVRASRETERLMKKSQSPVGVTFEYGPFEQKLFRFLNEYGKITVREFANLVDISRNQASHKLVDLVSAGVLSLFNGKRYDYFTFSKQDKEEK